MAEAKRYGISVPEQLKDLDDLVCFILVYCNMILICVYVTMYILDSADIHWHKSENVIT